MTTLDRAEWDTRPWTAGYTGLTNWLRALPYGEPTKLPPHLRAKKTPDGSVRSCARHLPDHYQVRMRRGDWYVCRTKGENA